MGHFLRIMVGIGALFAITGAQQYDASIIQNGNTWTYFQSSFSNGSGGSFADSGTVKFTVDSVAAVGDTLKFSVTREANGTSGQSTQTARYFFANNAFSVSLPFAETQFFYVTDAVATYKGEINGRYRFSSSSSTCSASSTENLQHLGQIRSNYSYTCGNNRSSSSRRLLEFNGKSYEEGKITILQPAALNPAIKRKETATSIYVNQGILFAGEKGMFNMRGQRVALPPP
jgi:hypothetical protein